MKTVCWRWDPASPNTSRAGCPEPGFGSRAIPPASCSTPFRSLQPSNPTPRRKRSSPKNSAAATGSGSTTVFTELFRTARRAGASALREADRVILTFGTAWVYELRSTGEIVANCHKQPAELFRRRRLTVEEIVARYDDLQAGPLAGKQVILTVSPVRHLGDGLPDNFLSKATLRLAIDEICRRHADSAYFPAYEILTDDLRDYRFYADDLVHPSQQAQQYIWELFTAATLTEEARRKLPQVEALTTAAGHRPLHPESDEYRRFCRKQLEIIESLPEIDLSREKEFFNQFL